MRPIIVFVLGTVALTSPAAAEDWPAADTFIAWGDCSSDQCRYSRTSWADEYRGATTGQYQGQRNVAFCLSTGCDGAIQINKVLGCAWRFVIANSGHLSADSSDAANLKHYCGPEHVTAEERQIAEGQAITLRKMINASQ